MDLVLTNWRGVVAPGTIDEAKAAELTELVTEMSETEAWQTTLETNAWDDAFLAGEEFDAFLTEDIAAVKTTLTEIGLL